MADKPKLRKALPGSYEDQRQKIEHALREAGTFGRSSLWVSDTFPDRAVVMVYAYAPDGMMECETYEVTFTESGGSYTFGEPAEVEKVEALVPAMSDGDETKGASMSQKSTRAPFKLKSLTARTDEVGGWDFEGSFSVVGVLDYSKDRMLPGTFDRSVSERLPKIKDHHRVTVGQATSAKEIGGELVVSGRIYPTTAGKDLAILMQPIDTDHGPAAPVGEGSIGFSPSEGGAKRNKEGGWDFSDVDVWEVSPVTWGDNPYTRIGLKERGAVEELATVDLLAYVVEVADLAVSGPGGAKALHARRKADGRDLTAEQWAAVDESLMGLANAAYQIGALVVKEGKAVSTAHLRYTGTIVQALADLLHGRPAKDPPPPIAEVIEEDDPKKKPKAEAKKGLDEPDGAEALRAMDTQAMRAEFERLGRTITRS